MVLSSPSRSCPLVCPASPPLLSSPLISDKFTPCRKNKLTATSLSHPYHPAPHSRTYSPPTIDLQIDARDELALIGGEEGRDVGDILGVRQSAQRHVEQELLHVFLGVRHADEGLEQAGARQQGTQRVDADLVFAVLGGETFRCLGRS